MMLGLDMYSQSRDVVGAMTNPTLHTLQPWSGVSVVPSGTVGMATRSDYPYQQGWVPTMGFGYFSGNGMPEMRRPSLETRSYEQASSATASEDGQGCRGLSPNDDGASLDMYDPPPVTPPPQRERFSYTRYQLEMLNGIFLCIRYPNSMQKQLVAKRVGITRDQVKIWFQNRRRKDIVGKKGKQPNQPEEELMPSSLMVPETIMKGVISELLKYEKDPSGRLQKSLKTTKSSAGKTPKGFDTHDHTSRSPLSEADSTTMVTAMMGESAPYFLPSDPGLDIVSGSGRIDLDSQAVFPPRSPSVVSVASTDDSLRVPKEVPTAAQLDMVAPPNVTAPPSKPRPFMAMHGASRVRRTKRTIDDTLDSTTDNCLPITPPDFYPPNKIASSRRPINFNGVSPVLPLSISIPGLSTTLASGSGSCTSVDNDTIDSHAMTAAQPVFVHNPMESFSHQYTESDTYVDCSLPKQTSNCRNNEIVTHPGYAASTGTMQIHPAPNQLKQYPMDRGYPFPALVPDQSAMFHSMCQDRHATKLAPAAVYRDPYQSFAISSYCGPYYGYDPSLFAAQMNDKTYMQL